MRGRGGGRLAELVEAVVVVGLVVVVVVGLQAVVQVVVVVVGLVVVQVVVGVRRLAEEGLHVAVAPGAVQHQHLHDLLALDVQRLRPQVPQADGRRRGVEGVELLLLQMELVEVQLVLVQLVEVVVGGGARGHARRRRGQRRVVLGGGRGALGRLLPAERLPLVARRGRAPGARLRAAAELVRLKPVLN